MYEENHTIDTRFQKYYTFEQEKVKPENMQTTVVHMFDPAAEEMSVK